MEITNIFKQIEKLYNKSKTIIVGIDGLGGAGKSTISELLFNRFNEKYNITVLHIDDFIHPKVIRYNSNFAEWECYYNLQWRYDYLLDQIIRPLQNGNDFSKKIELYDKVNDTYFLQQIDIPVGSIVIIEGIFLQREELQGVFDYVIYMDISEKTRLIRVLKRDVYIGNEQQIRYKYENRYFPAERFYVKNCNPAEKSDYIIMEEQMKAKQDDRYY